MKTLKSSWRGLVDYFTAKDPLSALLSEATPRVRRVLELSQKEALRLNHNFVGTEHALLGIILLGQGGGFNALKALGLDPEKIRNEIDKLAAGPIEPVTRLPQPFTPRLRRVLTLAGREAQNLNHPQVGTEHLLLGLIREGDGVAARVLLKSGATYETLRQQVIKESTPNSSSAEEGQDTGQS